MLSGRSSKSNTVRRNSVTVTRNLKNIPRVEIFLDSQLTKAITKIKQEQTLRNLSISDPQKKFSIEQTPEQSFKPSQEFRRRSSSNTSLVSKNPTLMPNDVVLSYIKQVYQKYGIKNPFEGYLDENLKGEEKQEFIFHKYPSFSDRKQRQQQELDVEESIKTHKKERKISQNQAKIFQLKNKFKQTIENQPFVSENTLKKTHRIQPKQASEQNSAYDFDLVKKSEGNITYIDRLTNLIESQVNGTYDFENDSTLNKTGPHQETPERSLKHINKFQDDTSHEGIIDSPQVIKPKKKLFVKTRTTSTKYNEKSNTPEKHKNLRVAFKEFQLRTQERNSLEQSKRLTSIINIEEDASVMTSKVYENQQKSHEYESQIPQVYRYCLGCEAAILDSNILFHQQKCVDLNQIQQLPLDRLFEIVGAKIDRIKKEISKSNLMNLELKDIEEIKSYATAILRQQHEMDKERNFRKDFAKVGSILSKNLLEGCELIKKLEWFMKVRQNLQLNYVNASRARQMVSPEIEKWQTG